jgi:hypothetical protein
VTTADWVSSGIALAAFATSALVAYFTWRWRIIDRRGADMTVYFHRNSEMAKVHVPSGEIQLVGYNLVLWNRGPSTATAVGFRVYNRDGQELSLVDLDDDEVPLSLLEAGARYPIPWLLPSKQTGRHFRCDLSWHDGNGDHALTIPLRRGETRQ